MTLQQVLDFLAVTQHGSLHAAARAAGQTQPALTKSLRRLEADLGAPLLVRHAKGVQATEFGQRFLVHAQRLAAEAQQARDTVAQMVGERRGRVEYGISAAASILLAPAAIHRFRRSYPDVELRCRSGLYHTLAPLLRDGRLDFIVCPLPNDVPDPQFACRSLMHSQMVLVARRNHPLADARSLAALQQASFTVAAPRGLPGAGIYQVFERAGLGAPHIELHTDGLIDTIAFVASSDCLALLPAALMHAGLLRDRLVVLPVADPLPRYEVVLFERRVVPLTPAADELAKQLAREAEYLKRP
jgi:LysR family transcriptional regulator, regulator of abg operon